ncbi:WS/DGAT/MGAT family acyltransferase [Microlunatus panaciterrae]|uniref:diacylglycerol O-acyltransferase n=1 Tax=Microlunatus panaciterrae TaxID=400768 RepID=A0ABS2RIX9_9ACTN|nr:wax ester/triacylglycerol synthase domain-containing protein [Microlunatus panaciterrae]MBM7798951.1 WS/DGAT/MGAT family acyltransferase [Microlunatus panaciterrae]
MDRLSADDRLVLWSDHTWPQDIGALVFLEGGQLVDTDGRLRIEALREALERRLHLLPRLRQVLYVPGRGLGRPLWLDAPAFDLAQHVHALAVPSPGDDEQVLRTVAEVRRSRLDPSRPLWAMWFLTGLTHGRVGLFIRLHHVMGDGMAGVASLAVLLDTTTEVGPPPPAPRWAPSPWPSRSALLIDNLVHVGHEAVQVLVSIRHLVRTVRRVLAAWPTLHQLLAAEPGPNTSLNRLIGPDRSLDLLSSRLPPLIQVAHRHGATVNDVLLTVIAGGLRGLLAGRGELAEGMSMPIYVPVSLRGTGPDASDHPGGNLIAQIVVPVPLADVNPATRLRLIAEQTRRCKSQPHPALGSMFRSRLLSGVMLKSVARRRVNVLSADLPGPRDPLFFCGARVLGVFPLLNLIGNVSLGVGAMSYAGRLCLLVTADADAYPDLHVFTDSARRELDALLQGVSTVSSEMHHPTADV